MPVTVSYPGVYIEEIPNPVRTITGVPTSITAFVGYSHPFKTKNPNKPIPIFSFAEYEREFGGLFHSEEITNYLPYAVYHFFLNGGASAIVVGIVPEDAESGTVFAPDFTDPNNANAIQFVSKEITTSETPITIKIKSGDPSLPYDVEIDYRNQVEVFRGLTSNLGDDTYIETQINENSQLVSVSPPGGSYSVPQQCGYGINPALEIINGTAGTPSPANDFADSSPPSGIYILETEFFNILCLPGINDTTILGEALTFAEEKRTFMIIDPPSHLPWNDSSETDIQDHFAGLPPSTNGALYYPWLMANDPIDGVRRRFPPSGYVAGIYADTDANRGVWKAPAGIEAVVRGISGGLNSVEEEGKLTDPQQGVLNKLGINAIRAFPVYNTIVWGARTLVGADQLDNQWKYVPVRRMALFIEETLYQSLKWVVFEPNDEPLWASIRMNVTSFMMDLFNQRAFQGKAPRQAFLVKCDADTTTQRDINLGIVNILVGFAPLKPAEFVIIKLSQLAGQAQA